MNNFSRSVRRFWIHLKRSVLKIGNEIRRGCSRVFGKDRKRILRKQQYEMVD